MRMKILRLALNIGPTSAPYNQFTLPVLDVHQVTFFTYWASNWPVDRRIDYRQGTGRSLTFLRDLWRMLRTEKFDVVHVHSPHLGLLFTLVAMFSRPSVLRRSVLHVHSNYHVYRPRNRWMLLPAFLAFGRIVCCSRSSRASFPWPYRLAAGRRLVTICNGVDLRRVDAAWQPMGMRTHKRDRPLQLITVGHLRALKNQATVIRAVAQARSEDVCLKIVGDGPDRGALEELAESLGLASRVTFTGRLGRDEVFQQLWRADAFIAMSRGEGLPIAVLEAMSCHCPVVLSDIPGHREVSEGRTDLVPFVKPDDCASLARAIDAWADMPLDVLRAWGADCRLHVEQQYTMDNMLDLLEDVFDQVHPRFSPEWEMFCRCMRDKRRPRKAA